MKSTVALSKDSSMFVTSFGSR